MIRNPLLHDMTWSPYYFHCLVIPAATAPTTAGVVSGTN